MINDIEKALPLDFKDQKYTYVEPFVGGGAVLFWMLENFPNIERAIINDINGDLTNCYKVIADQPQKLISILEKFQKKFNSFENDDENRKKYYLEQRALFNTRSKNEITQAALLIFLNKTCFNGLYCVNKSNGFNVPMGDSIKKTICDKANLLAVSKVLQRVEILTGDYKETLKCATENTLFYFDPPYKPLSNTSSFNSYAKDEFGDEEQIRLRDFSKTLDTLDHKWILSNSDVKGKDTNDNFFDDLYNEFNNGVTLSGRALRFNLLFFKEKNKRIYTAIPNAKLAA